MTSQRVRLTARRARGRLLALAESPRQRSGDGFRRESNRDSFDAGRQLSDKGFYSACYAPFTSMYFDQFGKVRACCQNTNALLGDIATQSIREIWDGAGANAMRDALRVRDFSQGCDFCQWQVDEGNEGILYARGFDRLAVAEQRPRWPRQMEFSMTNSCNLQCEMCNGDWSSSIRANREHRAPLPVVYSDGFFDELSHFLPHLERANFLGGEPFLGREPLRVMDMLVDQAPSVRVGVTTNGTQWTPRIERICEALPIEFVLSLDGITKSTYESIRVGANFESVMANLRNFQRYAASHGCSISLAHCLMRSNWREFCQILRFAEDEGLLFGINQVLYPVHVSLFQMQESELREVVETMGRQDAKEASSLTRLRPAWDGQLRALRNRLALLEAGDTSEVSPWEIPGPPSDGPSKGPPEDWIGGVTRSTTQDDLTILTEWASGVTPSRVTWDEDLRIVDYDIGLRDMVGTTDDLVGLPLFELLDLVDARFGGTHESPPTDSARGGDIVTNFVTSDGTPVLQVRTILGSGPEGTTALFSHRSPPDSST